MDNSNESQRSIAVSWTIHAMKNIMGMHSVRNKIFLNLHPNIQNIQRSVTFDAFQPIDKIIAYCNKICKYKPYIVFTAANPADKTLFADTHYQSFYLDNEHKHLYIIDPSRKNNANGIYLPHITHDVIKPFFEKKGYVCEFIEMTNPAQSITQDVFCQSWTMYLLLNVLNNGIRVIPIPRKQLDRYSILLNFFKDIINKIPTLQKTLRIEYAAELATNQQLILADGTKKDFNKLMLIDPVDLLNDMQANDML